MFEEVKELNKRTAIRLAIASLIAIGTLGITLVITGTQPKRSQYCAKCHNHVSFNNACKKSLPKDIACIECHTHENKTTAVLALEIRDEHCTTEQCHPLSKLSAQSTQYKKLKPFQHKTHLIKESNGKTGNLKLRCTSCHAAMSEEKHFEIDTSTCNICHFIPQSTTVQLLSLASPSPQEENTFKSTMINLQQSIYTKEKISVPECTLCHGHIEKSKEIYGKIFQHDVYEKNEKVSCSDCHFKITQGDGIVDKNNCHRCHAKISDTLNNVSELHAIHIDKHKTACTSCHTPITHGWPKTSNKIYGDNNLKSIDSNYKIQNLTITGLGGMGIKGEPDPMYLATLNCSACHKDEEFYTNVAAKICNNCHDKGFDTIVSEQMQFVKLRMQALRALLMQVKRHHTIDTDTIVQQIMLRLHPLLSSLMYPYKAEKNPFPFDTIVHEAEINYNLIKEDGSFGVHNIKHVKDLLDYSIANLKQIVK